jgi:enediyne polyketide synthase
MTEPIAIVGMACRYPDARSPEELWEAVLAERRAFRRLPPERLSLDDYFSPDRAAPDRTYCTDAALLTDYEFDRVAFRVVGETFRAADWVHWLALDVACAAVEDAGFGGELPRERTGVFVGNTLTGEFSRASQLRLRWPFVARMVGAELDELGWDADQRAGFLARLEERVKRPFPPIGSETLSGVLANTIAGRICNHLDLKGGGYIVDGACASSSLAVAEACSALATGDLDVAIAGGVDLSIDPAELVGFAKVGALAEDEMRVFDQSPTGFFPGEGAGMVVLTRAPDARERGQRVRAAIRGWGIASDGSGGISRPEAGGQYLAMERAYTRAGFGAETVGYFECHGTGTEVGDRTELEALHRARRDANGATPAAVGTIKANFGHTKAAAGAAALIKATMAVEAQVVPPTTGCRRPHDLLEAGDAPIRAVPRGEPWPADTPLRAGVSAFGFGGIDTHLVIEAADGERRAALTEREQELVDSGQDCELVLVAAADADGLRVEIDRLRDCARWISRAELADLAAHQARAVPDGPGLRAAVVATTPTDLEARLDELEGWLGEGEVTGLRIGKGIQLGRADEGPPRIGFLFPGQGTPVHVGAGAVGRRFPEARAVYDDLDLAGGDGQVPPGRVQLSVIAASLAALRAVERLGIAADLAVGHSLGELAALSWAGAIGDGALLRIARARGEAMTAHVGEPGTMAAVNAGNGDLDGLLEGSDVTVACFNAPRQLVVSGSTDAVGAVVTRAREAGIKALPLKVTGAFHSPLMSGAVTVFERDIAREELGRVERPVFSTVTGGRLEPDADLRTLLAEQIMRPVRFTDAAGAAVEDVDLLLEIGPGKTLARLVGDIADTPTVSMRAGEESARGLLEVAGAAWVAGAPVAVERLFDRRLIRPLDPARRPSFLANPCEAAPLLAGAGAATAVPDPGEGTVPSPIAAIPPADAEPVAAEAPAGPAEALAIVRRHLAALAELPETAIADDAGLLSDLHMNSITITEVAVTAAQAMGRGATLAPMELADPTVAEFAEVLAALGGESAHGALGDPNGLEPWVRCFAVELREVPASRYRSAATLGSWTVLGPDELPIVQALRAAPRPEGAGADAEHAVVVCVPPHVDERHVALLLEGARRCRESERPSRFVLVQQGRGAGSFARSLHLESPDVATTVVDLPAGSERADLVLDEAAATAGYVEAHYDADGVRREPRLITLEEPGAGVEGGPAAIGPDDVVLVTGGGSGIGAECALALGRATGARLALLGRATPAGDPALADSLARFGAAGLTYRYAAADVCDADELAAAVADLQRELGPVTAAIHAAGTNTPRRLADLTEEEALRTLAPKLTGLRNVVDAVDADRLRLLVTFGSAAAAGGMPGGADYALANEWQTRLTEDLAERLRDCRCLAVEWSNWADIGMSVRLGATERLAALGIVPIPPERGTELLVRLVEAPSPRVATLVSGRFGNVPTLRVEEPELPLYRFLERPRVHYPGVELIADAELSLEVDPYLGDHQIRGVRIFPAVMGLEAMAQAAMALRDDPAPPTAFEDVSFERPIVMGALDDARVIRLIALARSPDAVEVAVRSDETEFQVDHLRAVCRFGPRGADADRPRIESPATNGAPALAADELYERLLFQQGRFRRVAGYRELRSTRAVAEIAPDGRTRWFGGQMPDELVLGDPGARDAAVHAGQMTMPDVVRLPTRLERIELDPGRDCSVAATVIDEAGAAIEVLMADGDGDVHERWSGLEVQVLGDAGANDAWPAYLFGPYVERRIRELANRPVEIVVREDGAAEAGVRIDAAGEGLLASEVRAAGGGEPEVEAARIAIVEACAVAAGRATEPGGPPEEHTRDGWVAFAAGADRVWTWATDPRGPDGTVLVFAILVEGAAP